MECTLTDFAISLLYSYFKSHMLFRQNGRRFWSVPCCFYIGRKVKHFLILNLVTKRCFDFISREFQIIVQLDDERSLSTMRCFDNLMLPCRENISLFRLFQTSLLSLLSSRLQPKFGQTSCSLGVRKTIRGQQTHVKESLILLKYIQAFKKRLVKFLCKSQTLSSVGTTFLICSKAWHLCVYLVNGEYAGAPFSKRVN